MTLPNNISFRVFSSSDTNDHEVRIFVDGKPFIAEHWPDMMGLDPDDILANGELSPREEPHRAMVVRCGCGIAGSCGSPKNGSEPMARCRLVWRLAASV